MAVQYLEITFRNYLILEVLRGASILRVFLRNTRRLVIFFYQLLQEYFFSPLPSCGTPVPSTLSYALTRDADTALPVCAALAWLPWSRDHFAGERC